MVRIIAHRGSSRLFPENSLAAFRYAVRSGADSLEVDIRHSADGQLYCFHDHHLARLTGYSGYFRRTNSETIDNLRLLSSPHPVLRFSELLDEFLGEVEIVLDIKSAGIEEQIVKVTGPSSRRHSVVYSSFDERVLQRIKALAPTSRTALIIGGVRSLKVKLDAGRYVVGRLKRLGCDAAHLSSRVAKEGLVSCLHNAGFAAAVWTVDDIDLARKYIDIGIEGIITNVPEVMHTVRADISPRHNR